MITAVTATERLAAAATALDAAAASGDAAKTRAACREFVAAEQALTGSPYEQLALDRDAAVADLRAVADSLGVAPDREAMIAALGARPVEVLTEERLRAAMYTALPGDGDGAGVLFACLTSSGPVALPTPVDREALIEARETMATWPRRAIDDRAIAALDAILAAPVAPSPAPVEAGPRYVDTSGPRYVVTTTARASIPADREAKAMNEGGRAFYPYLYGEQPNQETYPAAIVDILGGAK